VKQSGRQKSWASRDLITVDQVTGEVIPGHAAYLPLRIRVGDHIAVMQEAALAVALDREITPTAFRVLKYLEAVLDYENAIRIVQADIGKTLDIDKANVSKAFKLLLTKGIIERIECPSLKPVYRLNPHYGWRGKHSKWKEEKNKARPLTLLKGGRNAGNTPK
jgi:hypothetical protein